MTNAIRELFRGQTSPISAFLGSRLLLLLGEISFGMYLFHTVIIRYYQTFLGLIDPSSISWRVLYWASVVAIAYLAFELVEKPARQAITRRASKNEAAKPRIRIALLFIAALIAAGAILRPHA